MVGDAAKNIMLLPRLTTIHNHPKIYRLIQIVLVGPIVGLWGGVAYWFGFGSEAILKTVFPPMLVPILLTVTIVTAFFWTMLHLRSTSGDKQITLRLDTVLCLLILFSMIVVLGQVMAA